MELIGPPSLRLAFNRFETQAAELATKSAELISPKYEAQRHDTLATLHGALCRHLSEGMEQWLQGQSILFLPKDDGDMQTFMQLLPTHFPLYISTPAGLKAAWEAMNSLTGRNPMFGAIMLEQGSVFIAIGIARERTTVEWQQTLQHGRPSTHAELLQLTRKKRVREEASGGSEEGTSDAMLSDDALTGDAPPKRGHPSSE